MLISPASLARIILGCGEGELGSVVVEGRDKVAWLGNRMGGIVREEGVEIVRGCGEDTE